MMTLEEKRKSKMWCDHCEAGIERGHAVAFLQPYLGREVKRRRKDAGMTQADLVRLMKSSMLMGAWSVPKMSQVETGARKVTAEELMMLALIFGCSADDFLPDFQGTPGLHPEATEQGKYQPTTCPMHSDLT